MSNTASLELSKKLYERSGWEAEPYVWHETKSGWSKQLRHSADVYLPNSVPAYPLGYLLRKLPKETAHTNVLVLITEWEDVFYCGYAERNNEGDYTVDSIFYKNCQRADTPEDAACKLAIELIKQGILKGEK